MREKKNVHKFEKFRVAEKNVYLLVVASLNNYHEIIQFKKLAGYLRTQKQQEKNCNFPRRGQPKSYSQTKNDSVKNLYFDHKNLSAVRE